MKLNHFSASQVNTFLAEPALWILRRFWGVQGEASPAMYRGTAVESALDTLLYKPDTDMEECLRLAMESFELQAQGEISPAHDKARDEIEKVLGNLVPWIKASELPTPTARQMRIEYWIDGIDIPVIGYLDYLLEDCLIDLKTTGRAPGFRDNRLWGKDDHLRQCAVYRAVKGVPAKLLYAMTAKDREPILYEISDHEKALKQVHAAVRAMVRLNNDENRESVAELYPPQDINGFRWDDTTRKQAEQIWRL